MTAATSSHSPFDDHRDLIGFSDIHAVCTGPTLHICCTVMNADASAWRPEDGYAFGYLLFDEPTKTLIVDGARVPVDLSPGSRHSFDLHAALPPEPGEYEVFCSLMVEGKTWFYQEGWPFLRVAITVSDDGAARIRAHSLTTQLELEQRRRLRMLVRSVQLPLAAIWKHRRLIRTLVKRDVLGRYRGSFGGAFWAVLNPLLLMLTYFLVFGLILQSRFSGDPSRAGFALYFLAGMLPWLPFNEAIGRAPFNMIEHRTFIKKLKFPVETLPVNLVAAGLVTEFFVLVLFLIALLIARGRLPFTVIYLPALLVPQVLFTAGLTWFLAALGVFFRDLAQLNGFLLTLWFFVTPICYEEKQIPPYLAPLMTKNPLYVLVRGYRSILLESKAPKWSSLFWVTVVSVLVFLLGHAWFHKLRKSFADMI